MSIEEFKKESPATAETGVDQPVSPEEFEGLESNAKDVATALESVDVKKVTPENRNKVRERLTTVITALAMVAGTAAALSLLKDAKDQGASGEVINPAYVATMATGLSATVMYLAEKFKGFLNRGAEAGTE